MPKAYFIKVNDSMPFLEILKSTKYQNNNWRRIKTYFKGELHRYYRGIV